MHFNAPMNPDILRVRQLLLRSQRGTRRPDLKSSAGESAKAIFRLVQSHLVVRRVRYERSQEESLWGLATFH